MLFEDRLLTLSKGIGIPNRDNIRWCTHDGRPSSSATQKPLSFISSITSGAIKVSAEDLAFRDTDYFIAGEIHQHYVWEQILHGYHKQEEILKYISKVFLYSISSSISKANSKEIVTTCLFHRECFSKTTRSATIFKILSLPHF